MKNLLGVLVVLSNWHYFAQINADYNQIKQQKDLTAVFEENKGQMKDQFWAPRPDVLYYGTSEGMNYYIKNSGMSYQLSRIESWKDEEGSMQHFQDGAQDCKQVPDQIGTYRVDAEWLNSNPNFEVIQGKVLDGYNNYYNVPEGVEPVLFVKKYETLTLKNVWEGIDLHYYGTNGFLETDYLVAPGADYQKIQIQFKGAELSTDESGNLLIKTPFGEIQEGALKVYQNNERIEAYWNISEDNVVSFEIPNYNADLALRIDPLTRVWGTYYGGGGTDYIANNSMSVDLSENIYIGGYTFNSQFGISSGGHQNTYGGLSDCFLIKFNSSGNRLWGTYYGGSNGETGGSVTVDSQNNVFLAGKTSSTNNIAYIGNQNTISGGEDAFLVKFNELGSRLWGTYVGGTGPEDAQSVKADANGNIYITGSTGSATNIAFAGHQNTYVGATNSGGGIGGDAYLIKFSSTGTLIWGTYYGGSLQEFGWSIHTDLTNNVYLTGMTQSNNNISSLGFQNSFGGGNSDAFLVKFNSAGTRIWATYYGSNGIDKGLNLNGDITGNVYLSGNTTSSSSMAFNGFQMTYSGGSTSGGDAFLVKFNPSGSRIWASYYGGSGDDNGFNLSVNSLGDVYLCGTTSSNSLNTSFPNENSYFGSGDAYLVKFNSIGNRIWGSYFGGESSDDARNICITNSSKIYISGNTQSIQNIALNGFQSSLVGGTDLFLTKFAEPKVNGVVWNDWNANCLKESSETNLLSGNNFTIQPGNYITQSINGTWSIDSLPAGTYTITIDTTNLNWMPTCPIAQSFTVNNPNDFTVGPDFGLISTNPCSDPDVSIYAPFLRRCLPNQKIYVFACNQTTATGILSTSYVDVELDPLMTVTASSLPFTSLGNSVYRFQTGNLNPGQCVDFNITVTISCNAMLGETLCMDATLYPVESCALDTIPSDPPTGGGGSTGGGTLDGLPAPCTLPWDQSSLSVDGWCQNDTIYFTITNTGELGGGDMECYSPLWVTVDGVVTFTDSIMIQGGQTITYSFPGDGATWILNASQHPLHPGNSQPNAHVEACGSDISNWTPDLVNDFPLDDADPVVDIYCGVVTGSYDPNDKTGYPNGVTDQYYIQPNQQLQYVIRFQNTGTDTAFTVVIRDTLDTDLNIFTVTPGVSSHAYDFRMYGPRVLEWTFNNINLPDSTTDLVGSNGFVTFHLEQVPDLAPGTEITNDADIYFDYNEPITTNTTMHRIYEGFVSVAALEEMSKEEAGILVYPNPNHGEFTIMLENNNAGNYSIFDQQGRLVKRGTLDGLKTTIDLELQSGMYYLMVGDGVVKVQINN